MYSSKLFEECQKKPKPFRCIQTAIATLTFSEEAEEKKKKEL